MAEAQKNPSGELQLDIVKDIENQSVEQLRKKRLHERLTIRTKVLLRPGNASEMHTMKVQGITRDLSNGGCLSMFPVAVKVGDIYRLEFAAENLDLPVVFARCLRCRMIHEQAFEVGFSFFNQISLTSAQGAGGGDLLE